MSGPLLSVELHAGSEQNGDSLFLLQMIGGVIANRVLKFYSLFCNLLQGMLLNWELQKFSMPGIRSVPCGGET